MGIKGLLPILKPISSNTDISNFAGKRVGVDAYVWLHRGAIGCAAQLCTSETSKTAFYINYTMHRVKLLLHYKVIPILVFDGADLPMKASENCIRRKRRKEALQVAHDALVRGNNKLAESEFIKAVEITPEMAHEVIRQLRKINVEYVVAPYEADAQLTSMVTKGHIDAVITEDSDLVAYGAEKIIYKMNKFGEGQLVQCKDLGAIEEPCMRRFTPEMFLWVCVLSGCDFFGGVNGLGLKKGHDLVRRYRRLPRVLNYIKFNRKYKVSESFSIDFYRACLVFRHQTVYDCGSNSFTHLNPLDDIDRSNIPPEVFGVSGQDYAFLGSMIDELQAQKLAEGMIHPFTLQEYAEPLDDIYRPIRNNFSKLADAFSSRQLGARANASGSVERRSKYWKSIKGPIRFDVKSPSINKKVMAAIAETYLSPSVKKPFQRPRQASRSSSPTDADEENTEDSVGDGDGNAVPRALQKWILPKPQSERLITVNDKAASASSMPLTRGGLSLRPRKKETVTKRAEMKRRGTLSLSCSKNRSRARDKEGLRKGLLKRPRPTNESVRSFWSKRARKKDVEVEATTVPAPPSPPRSLSFESGFSGIEDAQADKSESQHRLLSNASQSDAEGEELTPVNVKDSESLFQGRLFRSPFLRGNGTARITMSTEQDKRRVTRNLRSLLGGTKKPDKEVGCGRKGDDEIAVEIPPKNRDGQCRTVESTKGLIESFRKNTSATLNDAR